MLNELLGIQPAASEHAYRIDEMLEFCHWFMLILFIGWVSFFIYMLIRFRQSAHPKADYRGMPGHVSSHLEFGVVLIEAILLIGFAIPLWWRQVEAFPDVAEAQNVRAVAYQFGWRFHYPGADNIYGHRAVEYVSSNNPLGLNPNDPAAADDYVTPDLNLPVGQAAVIGIMSQDVIHNFALPHMRVSQDAVPGSRIPVTFVPNKEGEYEIICGQLCGSGHGVMKGLLTVHSASDFDSWRSGQSPALGYLQNPAKEASQFAALK